MSIIKYHFSPKRLQVAEVYGGFSLFGQIGRVLYLTRNSSLLLLEVKIVPYFKDIVATVKRFFIVHLTDERVLA
jgi:hypothetical protein